MWLSKTIQPLFYIYADVTLAFDPRVMNFWLHIKNDGYPIIGYPCLEDVDDISEATIQQIHTIICPQLNQIVTLSLVNAKRGPKVVVTMRDVMGNLDINIKDQHYLGDRMEVTFTYNNEDGNGPGIYHLLLKEVD